MSDTAKTTLAETLSIDERDDMFDSADDLQRAGALRKALAEWQKMTAPYWRANQEAMRRQSRYRWLVTGGVWAGCSAVILAILQLFFGGSDWLERVAGESAGWARLGIVGVEAFAALLAAVFVFIGLATDTHEEWLLERHRAERLRLLKYRSLIDFAAKGLQDSKLESWTVEQRGLVEESERLDLDGLKHWISVNHANKEEFEPSANCITEKNLDDFLDYYNQKRLTAQTNYFLKKSKKAEQKDWVSRRFPAVLLILSFVFTFAHFGIDFGTEIRKHRTSTAISSPQPSGNGYNEERRPVSGAEFYAFIFLALAACAPVLGSAIRTYRNAYEFSRNSLRFLATYRDLDFRSGCVANRKQSPDVILKHLWKAEDSLEREHREWLRLMVEAEWYG